MGFGKEVHVPQGVPAVPVDAENAVGVPASGPIVIPAVRGAPLLPRSLTVGRSLDKVLKPSGQPIASAAGAAL